MALEGGTGGGVVCSYQTGVTPTLALGDRVAVRGVITGRALTDEGFDVVMARCELAGTPAGRLLEDEPQVVLGPSSGGGSRDLTATEGLTLSKNRFDAGSPVSFEYGGRGGGG